MGVGRHLLVVKQIEIPFSTDVPDIILIELHQCKGPCPRLILFEVTGKTKTL